MGMDAQTLVQYTQAFSWRVARRLGLVRHTETLGDQLKDDIAPFDEYPACDLCNGHDIVEQLVTKDGRRIVACANCGLWFTSPRIKESDWVDWLSSPSERNTDFTENRIRYGVALSVNTKYALPNWRERRSRVDNAVIDLLEQTIGTPIQRLHDVGTGVGFLLQTATSRGIIASGNELNRYACDVMRDRLGLTVWNVNLEDVPLGPGSLDAVVMRDYIEHTYHPFRDVQAAAQLLRPGGGLYIHTFHIDSRPFDNLKGDWNMLFWNHCFHFSRTTLCQLIEAAGLKPEVVNTSYDDPMIEVVARKPTT